ncbi:SAV_6107 family HEPN domain-containing protein [Streptomyces griseoincarnatus]|uniref:SAV_6107 family HEPN domain-containing protein n=1 Tax=Streptomyces pseudogriseolus TaxID=36817 RepID=UPI00362D2B0A
MTSRGTDRATYSPEAADLLHQARKGLRESRRGTANERFATAHLAALRTAAAVLAARGGPTRSPRGAVRIRTAWEVLPEVAPELSSWASLFSSHAIRRARAEAGVVGAASTREAQELLREAETFLRVVERMLLIPTRGNLAV